MPVLRWPDRGGDCRSARRHGAHAAAGLGQGADAAPAGTGVVTGSEVPDESRPGPPSPDEWRRLEPMLDALLDAAPGRRAAMIAKLSAGDAARRAILERMLMECEEAYPLLDRPAGDQFGEVFGDDLPTMPGVLAGRYEVVSEVGRGGMAIVYLARDLRHGRDVAVKVVRPELAAALGVTRFLKEIQIAARLRHPHIVPLYDSGEQPGDAGTADGDAGPSILYYVMPYEPGRSLRERLARDGPLPAGDVVHILHDLCDALAHAHRNGIIHRDIKPENVLLSGLNAMIADFGVARAVSEARAEMSLAPAGMAVGTPTYMAPEQAGGDPEVDHRADIYSIGVLAHELLTGHPPSRATGIPAAARRIPCDTAGTPLVERPDIPEALSVLIRRCLATQPSDRWQSADELVRELESIMPTVTTAAAPSGAAGYRRRVALVSGVALGVAVLVVAGVVVVRGRSAPPPLMIGTAAQLTSEPGLEVQPSLSPDGTHVAYATGHSAQMRVAVRPFTGGRAAYLTTDTTSNQWFPRWSPDGTRILFLSSGGVFSAPASGGTARMEIPSRSGTTVRSATWSPNGREIAYVLGDSLLARTVESGTTRLIATSPDLHSCAWSPDASRL